MRASARTGRIACGTPARLSARRAKPNCGITTIGELATHVAYLLNTNAAAMCPNPCNPNTHWKS